MEDWGGGGLVSPYYELCLESLVPEGGFLSPNPSCVPKAGSFWT